MTERIAETTHHLKVWNVKENKRYICIGTAGFTDTSPEKAQGRVLVYNLKSSSDKGGGGGGMSVTSPRGDEDFSFFATATTSSAANAVGGNSNYSSSSSSTRNTSYKMRRLGEFHMQSPVYQVVPFMTR